MRRYTPLSQCSDYRNDKISLNHVLHLCATRALELYIWLPENVRLHRPLYAEEVKDTCLAIQPMDVNHIEYLAGACVSASDESTFLSTELSISRFIFDFRSFLGKMGYTDVIPGGKQCFLDGKFPKQKRQFVTLEENPIKLKIGQLFFWNHDYESMQAAKNKTVAKQPPSIDQLDPRKEKTYLQIIRAMSLALDLPKQPYKAAEVLQQIAAQHKVELPKKLDTIATKLEEARNLSE
jgi:hypothetical protein